MGGAGDADVQGVGADGEPAAGAVGGAAGAAEAGARAAGETGVGAATAAGAAAAEAEPEEKTKGNELYQLGTDYVKTGCYIPDDSNKGSFNE